MIEAIIISVAVEFVLLLFTAISAVPLIKKELKTLNTNFVEFNHTQNELVQQITRIEERLNNHIHDTHIHKS